MPFRSNPISSPPLSFPFGATPQGTNTDTKSDGKESGNSGGLGFGNLNFGSTSQTGNNGSKGSGSTSKGLGGFGNLSFGATPQGKNTTTGNDSTRKGISGFGNLNFDSKSSLESPPLTSLKTPQEGTSFGGSTGSNKKIPFFTGSSSLAPPPKSNHTTPINNTSTGTPSAASTSLVPASTALTVASNNSIVPSSTPSSRSSNSKSTPSVGLSCLSPDGLSLHSLLLQNDGGASIVTHFLPIRKSKDGVDEQGQEREEEEEQEHTHYDYKNEESQITSTTGVLSTTGEDDGNNKTTKVQKVITALPSYVAKSFLIDAPLELICVDNDTNHTNANLTQNRRKTNDKNTKKLPLLCVYSPKSAFLLSISYPTTKTKTVEGAMEEVYEPYESHLLHSTSTIRRIRPAPNSHSYGGKVHSTLSQRGAMTMLATTPDEDGGSGSGCLVLYHGIDPKSKGCGLDSGIVTTIDVSIRSELLQESLKEESFVDFVHLPSTHPSSRSSDAMWNGMGIILTTTSGTLYAVTPVMFHGMVFPRKMIRSGLLHLEEILEEGGGGGGMGSSTRWRMAKAALQYFIDVFGVSSSDELEDGVGRGGYYIMANVEKGSSNKRSATMWPVSVQGPLRRSLSSNSDEGEEKKEGSDNEESVTCLEILPPSSSSSSLTDPSGSGDTTGIVMARGLNSMEYMMVPSGVHLIPRFAFESKQDSDELNGLVDDCSWIIERIDFVDEDEDGGRKESVELDHSRSTELVPRNVSSGGRKVVLTPDPVDGAMIHHVSKRGVMTISSNALLVAERKLLATLDSGGEDVDQQEVKTTAWPSIETSGGSVGLNGVVVGGDAQLGHVLVAVLSDGKTEVVNVTAAQYLQEANNLTPTQPSQKTDSGSTIDISSDDQVLHALQSTKPLHELLTPLFLQITTGLSNMGKLVGGSSPPREITPGTLATFLSITQGYEQDVVLPLQNLNDAVKTRGEYLEEVRRHQLVQIERLKETIECIKSRKKVIDQKMRVAQSNSELLSERSSNVLSAARDLAPALTEAEREYFREIQRYEVSCSKWEGMLERMKGRSSSLREDVASGKMRSNLRLNPGQVEQCLKLLKGQAMLLKKNEGVVNGLESTLKDVIVSSGLDDEEEDAERTPLAPICNENTH